MVSTLSELSNKLRALASSLPQRANLAKQNVAKTINFDLLQTTPVDTGAAVSNWIVQLDEAASDIRDAFVPTREGFMQGPKGDKAWTHRADTEATRQANIGPAMTLAIATIESAQPGQPIHLTNSLPYIQALDEGHSQQAQLFVDRALLLGQDTITRAKLID